MSKAPSLPLYVRDWLCSRRILAMSGDAAKAFMYLLCEAWLQIPRATLPNNEDELMSMARVSKDVWKRIKSEVLACFKIGTCREHRGRLFNERELEESRKLENKQRLNNKNAKRTQTKRKPNTKRPIAVATAIATADAIADAVSDAIAIPEHLVAVWPAFEEMRKKIHKPLTDNARRYTIRDLNKLTTEPAVQIAILEQSIQRGWQGVFPLKTDKGVKFSRQEVSTEELARQMKYDEEHLQ